MRELLGADPDEKQAAILTDIQNGVRRVSVRSGHGVGKTTTVAWAIVCIVLTRFPQKTVCTAPTSSQLFDALAAEAKMWLKKLPPPLQEIFEIKSESIVHVKAPEESFVAFKTSRSETPEAMAGVHSRGYVYLFADEASGIPNPVFEAGSGSMARHNAVTVLTGNPVRSTGLFWDTHNKPGVREHWSRYHISCLNHPRIAPDFIRDMASRYGEQSNAFRVRVLGEFPQADDNTIIPRALMEAALERDVQPTRVRAIWGVDCARFGRDKSALARRQGNVLIAPVEEWGGLDTMQLVGRVKAAWDETPPSERPSDINVDVIGIGAGVCDRLRELKLPAYGINVSETAAMGEKYANLRAELWFKGLAWLQRKDCNLANDEALGEELVSPTYDFTSSGKLEVESKKKMRARGIESPNRADAFLLTLATEAVTASGMNAFSAWNEAIKRGVKGIV